MGNTGRAGPRPRSSRGGGRGSGRTGAVTQLAALFALDVAFERTPMRSHPLLTRLCRTGTGDSRRAKSRRCRTGSHPPRAPSPCETKTDLLRSGRSRSSPSTRTLGNAAEALVPCWDPLRGHARSYGRTSKRLPARRPGGASRRSSIVVRASTGFTAARCCQAHEHRHPGGHRDRFNRMC